MVFIKALIVGFVTAAPVGPIGFLCISRSLQHGFRAGFVTGLGAAAADGIYGCIAGLGITFIASFLLQHQVYLRILGAVVLLCLGIKTFRTVVNKNNIDRQMGVIKTFTTTFFLTLTNPLTILSFAAVFAAMGLNDVEQDLHGATVLALGVMLGSLAWWLLLSTGIGLVLRRLSSNKALQWVNRIAGVTIIALAGLALIY